MQTRALTRNEIVLREGRETFRRHGTRKDNPYRPGSADWRWWNEGFGA